ncbi:MAG: aspartate--tRNA ligase [Alphaproteobacteria bacterium]
MHLYRSHNCGELTSNNVGNTVKLSGWVDRKRDHGGLLFIDLRDHFGIIQIVIDNDNKFFKLCEDTRLESVITVSGKVVKRSDDLINKKLATGEIEISIENYIIESLSEILPMPVSGEHDLGEEVRLKNRFLDLRRPAMQKNMLLRSKIISSIRNKMITAGFHEFQTPILTASSPEGARDFLVPSRLNPGKFYALPQAPQQFKQLIMASGFDRYFQIAPCFRDEDARADRSPGEFYQLDLEMAFATQDDVFNTIEPVLTELFSEFSEWEITSNPFPKITFKEAMLKYGTDKPDLRNPLEICDVTEAFLHEGVTFKAFKEQINKGAVVRAIAAFNVVGRPRSFFDKLNAWAQEQGQPGLGYILLSDGEAKGPIGKFLSKEAVEIIKKKTETNDGDAIFFICNKVKEAESFAGKARMKIAEDMDIIEKNVFKFCWTVDFPMYELDESTNNIIFSHNPFSMPQGGMEALENKDPLEILAWQYDIICNGVELSSGAIRNHRTDIMEKAFSIAGYTPEDLKSRFGALYNAFKYGAPPHGGIAPGIDRIVMLLANEPNIREVIMFPMNQQAQDLLMDAPSKIDNNQLKELSLKLNSIDKLEK